MKPSTIKAIEKRRNTLRGGRSVRQMSREQWDFDERNREWRKVRNRMSYARFPGYADPPRITTRKEAA